MTSRPLPRSFHSQKAGANTLSSPCCTPFSLAAMALTVARGRAARSRRRTHRLQGELDRALTEVALLKEELQIKDDRWSRLPSRRRPRYSPIHRMRVLQLKAARGWSCEQAARALLIDEQSDGS